MPEDIKYWVWLSSIYGIGPVRFRRLIEHYGNPMLIWDATDKELSRLKFLNKSSISGILNKEYKDNLDVHLERIMKFGIKVVTINDEQYPLFLKNIYDPPPVLYVKGNILTQDVSIAVVGSRRASSYGLSMAENISYELSKNKITIVSGMARGIDSCAHRGALKAAGSTIAVLGCGLDIVYPLENKLLMESIIEKGSIISEYLPGTPPLPQNFPARNRIISGISLGVVVIEASENSGSLITANFALDQGREVFALPGNITSFNSQGTNRLIREGAKIVTGIEDIMEELRISTSVINRNCLSSISFQKRSVFDDLDEDERNVAMCLEDEPLHIDKLVEKSGLSTKEINSILVIMELKGVIEQQAGKFFRMKL